MGLRKDRKILSILFIATILVSACTDKTYFSTEDIQKIPYKIGDKITYVDQDGDDYKIEVIEITRDVFPDAPAPLKTYNESCSVKGHLLQPNGERETIVLLTLLAPTEKNGTEFRFYEFHKNYTLYDINTSIAELDSSPAISITTPFQDSVKVKVIKSGREEYSNRQQYVEKMFWSSKYGYVKWLKKNGESLPLKNYLELEQVEGKAIHRRR